MLDGREPEQAMFSVANAGGIPPEVLPNIFDPFRSGAPRGGQNEGLGLGLYIVQQIVQAHGGLVSVQAGAGRITFTMRLPRRPGTSASPG